MKAFIYSLIFIIILSVFLLSGCSEDRYFSKKDLSEDSLENEKNIEKIKKQLEPGLETDFKWYKAKMEDIIEDKKLELSACDYCNLWDNAYAYRDRRGARIIADYINRNGFSKFWRDCFYTLAEGQEKYPASLKNLLESDICEKKIGTALWNLFTFKELETINFPVVKVFVQEMFNSYQIYESLKPVPYTKKYPWTHLDYFKWVSSKPGDSLYVKDVNPLCYSPYAVAEYAFLSCHYESAQKALLEIEGGGLRMLYYSGHSIYIERNSIYSDNVCLITDDGHKIELKTRFKDIGETVKTLLKLSEERDKLPWLRQ